MLRRSDLIEFPIVCTCPFCGHKVESTVDKPCESQKCPKCGRRLIRGE